MAKEKDPAEVIESISGGIKASRSGATKMRAHRFRELFGYQAWSGVHSRG